MTDFGGLIAESRTFLENAWREGVLGVPYTDLLVAFAILAVALVLRGVAAGWLVKALGRALPPQRRPLLRVMTDPIKAVILIFALDLALRSLPLTPDMQGWADKMVRSLIAGTIFWGLSRLASAARTQLDALADMLTPAAVDWLVKSLHILFLIVGGAAVLEIWGVEVAPLLAGLGIFGVAVALGAQDLFKNLIAGFAILAEKRFSVGDWICVDGVVEGTVEQINFRSTIVRRFDLSPVYVPNTQLSDNSVTNFSRMTYRRINWSIGLEYDVTAAQLRSIRKQIEDYLLAHPAFMKPPETSLFVRIDAFAESSVNIMLYCFTRTTNWGEWLERKEELALAIKDIVEREGAAFAFPSHTLYFGDTARA